ERDNSSMEKYSRLFKTKNVKDSEVTLRNGGKHVSLNLGKSSTIEVRLFKGIVSWTSILKNLEFVDSLVEFTKNSGFSNLSLSDYLKYLKSLPSTNYR